MHAPSRMALPLHEGGILLVMPASGEGIAMTKLVTVHPENARSDLPTIQGEVVVMEAGTGMRLGILDGSVVTARRTAALSLLAARELALRPNGPLLIVGSGTQGRAHLEAFHEGLGTSRVFVISRTEESARSLAEHAENLGMEAEVVGEPGEALGEASLVVTATTSREPVLPDGVSDGSFVAAVGSFEPGGGGASGGAGGARGGRGRHARGRKGGGGGSDPGREGRRFLMGERHPTGRRPPSPERPEGTVVFKSVGHALWDLAAARTVFGG